MPITNALTPLSRSVVLPAAWAAHRRHMRTLGLKDADLSAGASDQAWDNRPLVELVVAAWGQSPDRVAHLLAETTPPQTLKGNPGKAARAARDLLARRQPDQTRLRAWADRVQALSWRQAELLQVMEEIEPYLEEALFAVQRLAVASVGAYAYLQSLLEGSEATGALLLDLVAGLETPEQAQAADMAGGVGPAIWRRRYGHHSDDPYELAAPRLAEMPLERLAWVPAVRGAWDAQQARRAKEQATRAAIAGAGFLQRSKVHKTVHLVQEALQAHAYAVDLLAHVLAAARVWSLAAAQEALHTGRIDAAEQIFHLELEEIKQVMTGEWHSREQIQPLVNARLAAPPQPPTSPPASRSLGVAGRSVKAGAWPVHDPGEVSGLQPGSIALVENTNILWTALLLKVDGVVARSGDFLSHTARVARAGALPAIVADARPYPGPTSVQIRLDPIQNRADYPI